uniref:UPAR/Ly6 domain-containing protein n=1 Tax=Noctiluca scintillans TaxID=2966 RepID=A7WQC7_NOCSC|nr:unknown [Noctiluca scintillans]
MSCALNLFIIATIVGVVASLSCNVGESNCLTSQTVVSAECTDGEEYCTSYTGTMSSQDIPNCYFSNSECSSLTCSAINSLFALMGDELTISNFQCMSCSTDNCNYEPIGSSGAAEHALLYILVLGFSMYL